MSAGFGGSWCVRALALALVAVATISAPRQSAAAPVGVLEIISPTPKTYTEGIDFVILEDTRNGDVTALVQAVDLMLPPAPVPSSTSGCEDDDFNSFIVGQIALIQRGICPMITMLLNAQEAGAVGVIVFNEGQPGRTEPVVLGVGPNLLVIPVLFTSFAVGNELAPAFGRGDVTVHLSVSGMTTPPVPEPAGLTLLGGVAFAAIQWRRRRAAVRTSQRG